MDGRVFRGIAYALLCAIWGSTWLAIRVGLEGAPAFLAASLRFVLAALVLVGIVAVAGGRLPRGRAEWALAAFAGLVLFTGNYGLVYWGENNGVESGLAAILFSTMPLQTALAAHAFLPQERLTLPKIAGIALGFAGILVIFRGQLAAAGFDKLLPMLAIVLAATCATAYTVGLRARGRGLDPVGFNAAAMGIGAFSLGIVSVAAGETWAVPSWPEGIGAILYLALAGSVVTFVAYQWLLKTIEATSMSYIALVTPIVAIFLGVTLGSEVFDPLALLGAGITLTGIYLSTARRVAAFVRPRASAVEADGPLRGSEEK